MSADPQRTYGTQTIKFGKLRENTNRVKYD